jgi:hypothetical protein
MAVYGLEILLLLVTIAATIPLIAGRSPARVGFALGTGSRAPNLGGGSMP